MAGLAVGALIASAGIAAAWLIYMRRRDLRLQIRERLDVVHTFLVNKWYFDELYDRLFVRPGAAAGKFAQSVIESEFVQGVLVGGTVGWCAPAARFARSIQTGYAARLRAGAARGPRRPRPLLPDRELVTTSC